MKALDLLITLRDDYIHGELDSDVNEAIKELESLQSEYEKLNENYWFARNHLKSYRCKRGSLGRVGYLCSNKECSEE